MENEQAKTFTEISLASDQSQSCGPIDGRCDSRIPAVHGSNAACACVSEVNEAVPWVRVSVATLI